MTVSNLNGRSLEYLLVKLISDNNPNITISESTMNAQNRDEANISKLNSELKTSMESSCLKIYDWIISELEELTEVIRFTDHQGTLGNPTDIKVISNSRDLNISLKHNNDAVKHQRPSATAQQFGYQKRSSEDLLFRTKYESILDDFYDICIESSPEAKKYNEVTDLTYDFLYKPMNDLVVSFINEFGNKPNNRNHYFKFIFGDENIFRVIANGGQVNIVPNVPSTDIISISAERHSLGDETIDMKNYIKIIFNGEFFIIQRLHTASSLIESRSLKYDTRMH
tara:strand:+ start:6320 stop:7165 length:846 start_codon:yes stop_codon:yes gene_type:complete